MPTLHSLIARVWSTGCPILPHAYVRTNIHRHYGPTYVQQRVHMCLSWRPGSGSSVCWVGGKEGGQWPSCHFMAFLRIPEALGPLGPLTFDWGVHCWPRELSGPFCLCVCLLRIPLVPRYSVTRVRYFGIYRAYAWTRMFRALLPLTEKVSV